MRVGGGGLQVPGAPFNMLGMIRAAFPVQTLSSNTSVLGNCSQGL
jgi:hypothetical protein